MTERGKMPINQNHMDVLTRVVQVQDSDGNRMTVGNFERFTFPESKSISWSKPIESLDWPFDDYSLVAQDVSDVDMQKLELVETFTENGESVTRALTLTLGQIDELLLAISEWKALHQKREGH